MKKFLLGFFFVFFITNNSSPNEIIADIEKNWNNINSMSGQFEQIDTDGNILEGNFYFLKPFKSKFIYNNRNENIITNESLLVVVDQEDFQIESYAIGNNILKKLLSKNIVISDEFNVISLDDLDEFYKLLLKLKNEQSNNKIQFTFDKKTLDMKKWEIYDEFDNKTVFKFTKIKKNIFISQNLFVVRYN